MPNYRVLFRLLSSDHDTITNLEVKDLTTLTEQLGGARYKYLYAHEILADGNVREVLTWETQPPPGANEEPTTSSKPRIRLKLSGMQVRCGSYIAYEIRPNA